ncbi:hypothetical protein DFH11DRAFT_1731833 [Phellopilus nigrolimitatus]|nr:hypothetical protein DFH11DRAFT_1731833 [Phellopilus nigrolimitatus]
MKVTDVNQALEAASAQEENTHALATKSISMDTSPAVTEVELHLSPFHSEFSLQVLDAFLRQEDTVDIYLLVSREYSTWVHIVHYTFAPQTRLLASRCAGRLRMDDDPHRVSKMYSSRSGRVANLQPRRGLVDGSDVHWIFRKHPKDGLRHRVLPYALDTEYHGMDP